jgi:lipoprotein-anchoring transpeptidase ErfK/SrfK
MRYDCTSILRFLLLALTPIGAAQAQTFNAQPLTPQLVVVGQAPQLRGPLGGGFIEFLFGGINASVPSYPAPARRPQVEALPPDPSQIHVNVNPRTDSPVDRHRPDLPMDPQFLPREVLYDGNEPPGTIVVDTPHHYLYLVEDGRRARRYGIGVGRPGFTWSGEHRITAKKEWPDWVPPEEMLQRQPQLPRFMPGGPTNPLGARALYLGNTLYRIHGSNEPWTIGHNVSSGCIRMRNDDVIDLYTRVKIGTKVVVI